MKIPIEKSIFIRTIIALIFKLQAEYLEMIWLHFQNNGVIQATFLKYASQSKIEVNPDLYNYNRHFMLRLVKYKNFKARGSFFYNHTSSIIHLFLQSGTFLHI